MSDTHLSAADAANLLAGQAVAEAEAYLAERRSAAQCAAAGHEIFLKSTTHQPQMREQDARQIMAPVRLLAMVMGRIGHADTDRRRAKWRRVMAALTDLVRHESLALRAAAASDFGGVVSIETAPDAGLAELRQELEVLEAKNAVASGWGAAVGARHERIVEIKRVLARFGESEAS